VRVRLVDVAYNDVDEAEPYAGLVPYSTVEVAPKSVSQVMVAVVSVVSEKTSEITGGAVSTVQPMARIAVTSADVKGSMTPVHATNGARHCARRSCHQGGAAAARGRRRPAAFDVCRAVAASPSRPKETAADGGVQNRQAETPPRSGRQGRLEGSDASDPQSPAVCRRGRLAASGGREEHDSHVPAAATRAAELH
jgi:hypothetical protein